MPPKPSPWTPEAISALGYKPLAEIAAMIGVTVAAVSAKHKRLGIPAYGAKPGPKPTRGGTADRRVAVNLTQAELDAISAHVARLNRATSRKLTPGTWLRDLALAAVKAER